MREEIIHDPEVLLRRLNELPNNFIFRGQSDADWQLQSSLERTIGSKWNKEDAKKFEDYALKQFRAKFHLYDHENSHPSTKLGWLAIMQHYGVPTRLVDFTVSPYVALYFALESYIPHLKKDFAVYAIDYSATMDKSIAEIKRRDSQFTETRESLNAKCDQVFELVLDRFAYDILWVTEPTQMNARLDRQAGSFLLAGHSDMKLTEIMDSEPYREVATTKFRIHHSIYENVFVLLRKMNITSKSLYGDLDGLARSIRMEMQVYAANSQT